MIRYHFGNLFKEFPALKNPKVSAIVPKNIKTNNDIEIKAMYFF
jgi:hypothetical protein